MKPWHFRTPRKPFSPVNYSATLKLSFKPSVRGPGRLLPYREDEGTLTGIETPANSNF